MAARATADIYYGDRPRRTQRIGDYRLEQEVTPDSLLRAARDGGDYLLRHLQFDGIFGYSYDPRTDTYADDYNLLRHAGTCYALAELQQAIDRETPQPGEQLYDVG